MLHHFAEVKETAHGGTHMALFIPKQERQVGGGFPAGGASVGDDAPTFTQDLLAFTPGERTDILDDNIHATAVREAANVLKWIAGLSVHGKIGAGLAHFFHL